MPRVGRKCRRYLCDCRIWVSTAEVTDWMRKCLTFSLELEEEHAEWVDDLCKKKNSKHAGEPEVSTESYCRVLMKALFFLVLWIWPNPAWQAAWEIKLQTTHRKWHGINNQNRTSEKEHAPSFFIELKTRIAHFFRRMSFNNLLKEETDEHPALPSPPPTSGFPCTQTCSLCSNSSMKNLGPRFNERLFPEFKAVQVCNSVLETFKSSFHLVLAR